MSRVWLLAAAFVMACTGESNPEVAAGGAGGSSTAGGEGAGGAATAKGWTTLASLSSGPRQENAVVALDGRVMVLGGFDGNAQIVDRVDIYDPHSDSWSAGTPLPAERHHINAAVVGGKLYLVGSLKGLSFFEDGSVFEFDPHDDEWAEKTPMPPGSERGASAVGVIGTKIYVAGGFRGGPSNDFAVGLFSAYDTESDAWEVLPSLPVPRDHIVGGVIDGVFYVVGGRDGTISSVSDEVLAFDPDDGQWRDATAMMKPRAGCARAIVASRLFVFGGEGSQDAMSGVFPDNDVFDGEAWQVLEPMPTPRHGTGAVAIDGTIYIPGGATTQAFGAVDVHEAFTP